MHLFAWLKPGCYPGDNAYNVLRSKPKQNCTGSDSPLQKCTASPHEMEQAVRGLDVPYTLHIITPEEEEAAIPPLFAASLPENVTQQAYAARFGYVGSEQTRAIERFSSHMCVEADEQDVYISRTMQHIGLFMGFTAVTRHEGAQGKPFDYVMRIRPDTVLATKFVLVPYTHNQSKH